MSLNLINCKKTHFALVKLIDGSVCLKINHGFNKSSDVSNHFTLAIINLKHIYRISSGYVGLDMQKETDDYILVLHIGVSDKIQLKFNEKEELEAVYNMLVPPLKRPIIQNDITDPDMLEDYNPP